MADDLVMDLEELRQLQSIAKRPRVVSFISSEIRNLEKLSKEAASTVTSQAQTPSPTPTPIPTAKVASNPALTYLTLGSFNWDQDKDKVKIYVSLEGVDQKKIETVFKPMLIDIKFHDVQGKNYRSAIPKLNKEIVPDKCKVIVKPTRVIITLPKASKGNWLDLHFKEDATKAIRGMIQKNPDSMNFNVIAISKKAGIVTVSSSSGKLKEICTSSNSDFPISHASQISNPFLDLPLEFRKCGSCDVAEPGTCEKE